jgi:hypothetical protein
MRVNIPLNAVVYLFKVLIICVGLPPKDQKQVTNSVLRVIIVDKGYKKDLLTC